MLTVCDWWLFTKKELPTVKMTYLENLDITQKCISNNIFIKSLSIFIFLERLK